MKRPSLNAYQQNLFELEASTNTPKPEHHNKRDYEFDLLDVFKAPVLTFSQLWADSIPKRMLGIIPQSRLIALMRGTELATYAECTVYLHTRSLEAPMDSDWTDIYTHVGCKTRHDWFREDHWTEVGAPKELNEWLRKKLLVLQHFIYSKRREILKQRFRFEDKTETAPEQEVNKPVEAQQRSFF